MAKPDNHLDLIIVVSGAPEAVRVNRNEHLENAVLGAAQRVRSAARALAASRRGGSV
jgi:hypothetical protein